MRCYFPWMSWPSLLRWKIKKLKRRVFSKLRAGEVSGAIREGLRSLKAYPPEPGACYERNTKLWEQWGEGRVTPAHQPFTAAATQRATTNIEPQPGQSFLFLPLCNRPFRRKCINLYFWHWMNWLCDVSLAPRAKITDNSQFIQRKMFKAGLSQCWGFTPTKMNATSCFNSGKWSGICSEPGSGFRMYLKPAARLYLYWLTFGQIHDEPV